MAAAGDPSMSATAEMIQLSLYWCTQGLDFFGGTPVGMDDVSTTVEWEAAKEDDRIVVLSDLHLDKPESLDRLETVLEGGRLHELDNEQCAVACWEICKKLHTCTTCRQHALAVMGYELLRPG